MNINKNELASKILVDLKKSWNDCDDTGDFITALLSRMAKNDEVDINEVILKLKRITSQLQTARVEAETIKYQRLGR